MDEGNGSNERVTQRTVLGGRYRVEDELGRGGMATVFRGTDTVLGRPVAVKVLASQYASDADFVSRFRREAQAAARLNHPNLVSVYDTGTDDGIHFIVMEYVEAKTLADYLAGGGRIMPERAMEIAESVCEALSVAHAHGIIHRDIKPGNIMITTRGDAKVMDFGIARVVSGADTVAHTAAVLGTASYLSPEQAQGQPVDQRSDIYSLGVVLYEMVTGRPPFSGDSAVMVASKHVLEQPTPPSKPNPDVSPALEAVIMKALAKNPDNRYQDADEMRADLERARLGQPVQATPLLPEEARTQVIDPSGPPTQVLPPGAAEEERRNRWWIPALIVLAILAVLGAGLFLVASTLLGNNAATKVPVPSVTGLKLSDAIAKIEQQGLTVARPIRHKKAPNAQPGTVVDQDPKPTDQVDKNSSVILWVPEAATIPSGLVGQPKDDVIKALEALGLKVPPPTNQASTDVPKDRVISLDPPEGSNVSVGSSVTIVVSSGPQEVTVPDVTCESFGQAKSDLRHVHLNPVQSSSTVAFNPACPAGNRVAAQDPTGGEHVPAGTTVTLFAGAFESPSPSPSSTSTP
jgi:eukaryotic-like serine/threonine-protein kinase